MSSTEADRDRVRRYRRQARRGTLSDPAVGTVVDLLSADEVAIRRDAAVTVAAVSEGRPAALVREASSLGPALTDEDCFVREKAALTLARVAAADPDAVRTAFERPRLADDDPADAETVQTLRRVALANPEIERRTAELLAVYLADPTQAVREKAALGVAELAESTPVGDPLERCWALLGEVGPDARANATLGLAVVVANHPGSPATPVALLADALTDPVERVRYRAVESLDAVGDDHPSLVRDAIRDRVDPDGWRATAGDPPMEAVGVAELACVRPDLLPDVGVAGLARILTASDPTLASRAANALVVVAGESADRADDALDALGALPTDDDPSIRRRVAAVVAELTAVRPRAVHVATRLLSEAIANDDAGSVADPYATLLTHETDWVRETAALALVTRGRDSPGVVKSIVGHADDPLARRAVRDAVGRADDTPDWFVAASERPPSP